MTAPRVRSAEVVVAAVLVPPQLRVGQRDAERLGLRDGQVDTLLRPGDPVSRSTTPEERAGRHPVTRGVRGDHPGTCGGHGGTRGDHLATRSDRGGRAGHGDERGGATVLAVACLGLLLVVAVALAEVGAWFAADRQVRGAADLAALAAAGEVATDPCGAAAAVADANGAELVACDVAGREVLVVTRVPAPSRWGPAAELTARARAGPG